MVRRAGADWRDYPDTSTLVTAQDYEDYSDGLDSAVGPGRTRGPLCIVHLDAAFTLGPANVFAQDGWSVTTDPDGMASLSTTAGTYSFISIPETGRYDLLFRAGSGSGVPILNYVSTTPDSTAAVAVDTRPMAVSNVVMVEAVRWSVSLTEGTKVYWGNWARDAGTQIEAVYYNIPTHVVVRWAGPD